MIAVPMTDVVVRDGSTVCVRQAEPGDTPLLLKFLQALSPQSLYYRFHGILALAERRMTFWHASYRQRAA